MEECRRRGATTLRLTTIKGLRRAAKLYLAAGFKLVKEEDPAIVWGCRLQMQEYEMQLL